MSRAAYWVIGWRGFIEVIHRFPVWAHPGVAETEPYSPFQGSPNPGKRVSAPTAGSRSLARAGARAFPFKDEARQEASGSSRLRRSVQKLPARRERVRSALYLPDNASRSAGISIGPLLCGSTWQGMFSVSWTVPRSALCGRARPNRVTDGPQEGGHLPRNRCGDHGLAFAGCHQPAIARAQTQLSLPGDCPDDRRQALLSDLQRPAQASRVTVGPGTLDQHPARSRVARLGDGAAPDLSAGRAFRGHQTKIGHQLPRGLEAAHIPDLRHEGNRRQKGDTAQGLVGWLGRLPPRAPPTRTRPPRRRAVSGAPGGSPHRRWPAGIRAGPDTGPGARS